MSFWIELPQSIGARKVDILGVINHGAIGQAMKAALWMMPGPKSKATDAQDPQILGFKARNLGDRAMPSCGSDRKALCAPQARLSCHQSAQALRQRKRGSGRLRLQIRSHLGMETARDTVGLLGLNLNPRNAQHPIPQGSVPTDHIGKVKDFNVEVRPLGQWYWA